MLNKRVVIILLIRGYHVHLLSPVEALYKKCIVCALYTFLKFLKFLKCSNSAKRFVQIERDKPGVRWLDIGQKNEILVYPFRSSVGALYKSVHYEHYVHFKTITAPTFIQTKKVYDPTLVFLTLFWHLVSPIGTLYKSVHFMHCAHF